MHVRCCRAAKINNNSSGRERTAAGLPVELDIGDLAGLVDERVGVHAKALHVAVVLGDAHVVLQERELRQRPKHNAAVSPTLAANRGLFRWPLAA